MRVPSHVFTVETPRRHGNVSAAAGAVMHTVNYFSSFVLSRLISPVICSSAHACQIIVLNFLVFCPKPFLLRALVT